MKTILIILGIVGATAIISQSYFIMASTETQAYQIVKTEKDFEIRQYPPATMASVTMNAKSYKELATPGFRTLAGFIFGGNQSGTKIAMTTPVHMDIGDTQSSMRFVMPAAYNKNNLPKPNDPAVAIISTEEEYVAAIKFGGYANDERIKKYTEKLAQALQEQNIQHDGHFRFLGYNAPYQFVGRKNEIVVRIQWPQ